MSRLVTVLATSAMAIALLGRALGQDLPNIAYPAECGMGYDNGTLAMQANANNTTTFTQSGVLTSCVVLAKNPQAPCEFCFSFQLLINLGGNVWRVIQPPYPVLNTINVVCNTSTAKNFTNTTPVLGVGQYEMTTVLSPGACDILLPGSIPTEVRKIIFTVKAL